MTRRILDCEYIKLNVLDLIPEYFDSAKYDSVLMIIGYWEDKCGKDQISVQARILTQIAINGFSEDIYNEDIIYYLYRYKEFNLRDSTGQDSILSTHDMYVSPQLRRPYRRFNSWIRSAATKLLPETKFDSLPYLFAMHYSGNTDSTFLYIRSVLFKDTKIHAYYMQTAEAFLDSGYPFFAGSFGYWIPLSQSNKVFGRHPEFCLMAGIAGGGHELNISINIMFEETPTPFEYSYQGVTATSTRFEGVGLGIEFGNSLIYTFNQELKLYLGFLHTIIYTAPESGDTEEPGLGTGHISLGAGYGFRLTSLGNPTLSLQIRYNIYLYNSGEINGPRGNSLSLRLQCSFTHNDDRRENLAKIEYPF